MAVEVTIDGLGTLMSQLKNYATDEQLEKGLLYCGLDIEREAKKNCVVDTGNLRASITTTQDSEGVSIGTNVEYAPIVEFGSSKMVAQPFLYPAYLNKVNNLPKYIRKAIKEG